MNQGVEIILKRMDSHPQEFEEEFLGDGAEDTLPSDLDVPCPRWSRLMWEVRRRMDHIEGSSSPQSSRAFNQPVRNPGFTASLPFLTDDEIRAIWDKWRSLQGPAFTRQIMRRLLEWEV